MWYEKFYFQSKVFENFKFFSLTVSLKAYNESCTYDFECSPNLICRINKCDCNPTLKWFEIIMIK